MKNKLLLLIYCISWSLFTGACSKNTEETPPPFLKVDLTTFKYDNNTRTIEIPLSTNIPDWTVTWTNKGVDEEEWCTVDRDVASATQKIKVTLNKNMNLEARTASLEVKAGQLQPVTITVEQSGTTPVVLIEDLIVSGDVYVKPSSGKASENQSGAGIEKTWDRSYTQVYHSIWQQSANFPVKLEYFFSPAPQKIDYMIYYPTQNGNGPWGNFDIFVDYGQGYQKQGSYNFYFSASPQRIIFPDGLIVPQAVKFEIHSGNNNFVACQELEFWKKNVTDELTESLLTVFTDKLCRELRTDVTQARINALPSYFAAIANAMKKGEYEKEFRIQSYPAYSESEIWAEKLRTSKYGNHDNATGIYVETGEEIVVLAGDLHGQNISLQSVTNAKETQNSYFLKEGVNKIKILNSGLLYVMYHTDITSPKALPVDIHIPMGSGKVNGYFDLAKHKTDSEWQRILAKATAPHFDIKGKYVMLTFHTSELKKAAANKIVEVLGKWDDLVRLEWTLMGTKDLFGSQFNHRQYGISISDGYQSATEYYTQYNQSILADKFLSVATFLSSSTNDNMWGPAHEFGHQNQKAIDWRGTTECSNNLFSNYVATNFGYTSRGAGIDALNTDRVIGNKAYIEMSDHLELQMRMYWQLYLYFEQAGKKAQFYPKLFDLKRKNFSTKAAEQQFMFVEAACEAAGLDLTDFFEMWGFFVPLDKDISQYGTEHVEITEAMVTELKQRIAAAYPKAPNSIHFIEDRNQSPRRDVVSLFKNNQKITKPVTYTKSGNLYTIKNGDEAVGFEVKTDDNVVTISNSYSFSVPTAKINATTKVYAVQADGIRKEVTAE